MRRRVRARLRSLCRGTARLGSASAFDRWTIVAGSRSHLARKDHAGPPGKRCAAGVRSAMTTGARGQVHSPQWVPLLHSCCRKKCGDIEPRRVVRKDKRRHRVCGEGFLWRWREGRSPAGRPRGPHITRETGRPARAPSPDDDQFALDSRRRPAHPHAGTVDAGRQRIARVVGRAPGGRASQERNRAHDPSGRVVEEDR